jgi:hypothetical protein
LVPTNRYQHLIDACGPDRARLADLAMVLSGYLISRGIVEAQSGFPQRLDHWLTPERQDFLHDASQIDEALTLIQQRLEGQH